MEPLIAVVIPTKDRSEAMEKYALPSLERSSFRDFVCFVCVVWDASGDDLTRGVVENRPWGFQVRYFKAPRKGSASQRNDAVRHVLSAYPSARYAVFMDDDSELSEDALAGVLDSFKEKSKEKGASIVNIPMRPLAPSSLRSAASLGLKRLLGMNRHGATPFLYNYGGEDESAGLEAEWAGGGGMGVDLALFRDMGIFFPEEFQRFGGYALGEDFAFSFYVSKKLGGRIVNSLYGHFLHYAVGGARLDVKNMAASKWYNFHLLFDAIYEDGGLGKPLLRFKLFMAAAVLKLLIRARSFDLPSALRGVWEARVAHQFYRRRRDASFLMRPDK
jgi:glycosyltransferase involved in cell wall biosynthesis